MKPSNSRQIRKEGFSLVEVAFAIGIVAFALVAILGLVPVGLRSVQDAIHQSRASEILNLAATAVRGQYYLGTTAGSANYAFANYLSDQKPTDIAADSSSPWGKHTKYYLGQADWHFTFPVLDDGTIRPATNTTSSPAYQLYVHVYPPPDNTTPVRVYLSVAWPGGASYVEGSGWKNQMGLMETVIYANPPATN
jgi:uncharacterized protein (TIGR02598 family)